VSDASSKSRELLASVEHRGRFHHGDLRRALIDATFDLIDRHGVRGFTLAHASRAAGVSRSAPYKHFASREDLLAAVSLEAFDRFHAVICATPEAHKVKDDQHPREAVRSFLRTYARFAFERPAEARAMFGSGVDKSQHEALLKKDTESFDFLILRRNFGAGTADGPGGPGSGLLDDFYQSIIPEPGSISLLAGVGLLAMRRRR
jgi:AcrR family transcriptional regulator